MRIALWIASPPTCSVRTPRASLTAMADPRREPLTPLNAARRAPDFLYVVGELLHGLAGEKNALPPCFGASISCSMALYMVKYDLKRPLQNYPRLYASIKACGMAWHAMNNMWFVISSDMSAYKIADRVRLSVDADDKVFVSRLSSDSAWCGLEEKGSDWLKKHM